MTFLIVSSLPCPNPRLHSLPCPTTELPSIARNLRATVVAASPRDVNDTAGDSYQSPTRFVTFLGKGGSGKTTASVFAAQHYAMSGLNTCLVFHNQDPSADYLLGTKIGNSPTLCNDNLSAIRLETTKMLLEPLNQLKQADSRLNMTQGVLEGVVGEELGVLPGMDSILSMLELERLVGFIREATRRNQKGKSFDVVIYDGSSPEDTLRMIGLTHKARLYLKYLRSIAEKTDLGRLVGPSIMRLVDESVNISSGNRSSLDGLTTSGVIWDALERFLERGASAARDPSKVGCFLVVDPNNPMSVNSALRYWGCTIQAGAHVAGALSLSSHPDNNNHKDGDDSDKSHVKHKFAPLPFASALIPHMRSEPEWSKIILKQENSRARDLLSKPFSHGTSSRSLMTSVEFDASQKSVTLFMPGFDKSEIKLYQYGGGSELLIEAGDQRRVIRLPSQIQGKVAGAKFVAPSLIITLR